MMTSTSRQEHFNNLQKQNIATRDLQLQEPLDKETLSDLRVFDLQSYDILKQLRHFKINIYS